MNAEIRLLFNSETGLVGFATTLLPIEQRISMAFENNEVLFHNIKLLGTTLYNVIWESEMKSYLLLKTQTKFPKKYFRRLDYSLIVANDTQLCTVSLPNMSKFNYPANFEGFENGDEVDLSEIFKLQRVELFEMFK